jgi:protein transport protein SEC61 subunit gamma and related proteins
VLKVTRKPTWPEYTTLAKVTGLGILVIGMIGFLLTFAKQIATVLLG